MAAQKKSISRKELLKKPDEFITTSNKIANWVTVHYQKVIWVGAVVVLVAGAFFGYRAYAAHQEKQGREAYFSALELPEITQKIKKLSAVTTDYPRTQGAQKAWISLGHLYYQQKDFTRALNAYRSALSRGKLLPEFQSLINESLAYVLEEKGDLKGAADTFSQILEGTRSPAQRKRSFESGPGLGQAGPNQRSQEHLSGSSSKPFPIPSMPLWSETGWPRCKPFRPIGWVPPFSFFVGQATPPACLLSERGSSLYVQIRLYT